MAFYLLIYLYSLSGLFIVEMRIVAVECVDWMSLALVGDRKGIRPLMECTFTPLLLFTAVLSEKDVVG